MSLPADEKRENLRIPFVLRVQWRDRTQAADATENLSTGGLFVQTDRPFEVGTRIPLTLSFPGLLDPIEVMGVVSWVRAATEDQQAGVGIQVTDGAERQRLEGLLNTEKRSIPADGFRVLIVEDNPHIIEMYSYVLKKLAAGDLGGKVPLEVHFAPDGHSALKQLKEGQFHLIMTDLYMPVMDGFILIEKIRAEEGMKGIPVIVISAGGKEAQTRANELGVDIYLRKPVRFVEVLETVKQLLHIK
jgi:uncharacterized protein (TIGR02266 family)